MAIGAVLILAVWIDQVNRTEGELMSLLALKGVQKSFGAVEVLHGVDLQRSMPARWSASSATTAPASRR